MTDARHVRLERIFLAACDLAAGERAAFLAEHCGDDAALLREIEAMLAADAADSGACPGLLEALDVGAGAHALASELDADGEFGARPTGVPETIGRYRILSVLGRGGMGLVYRAEQQNPRRTVALKILQPGLVRDDLLQRFAREAQVLGLLQHPGIASIYDAGTCDFGYGEMPYFAMEIVEGKPLTRFVDDHQLDTRARIGLLVKICAAVQHAHERGVVHRDLKPGNILVAEAGTGSGGPLPKILDFGIARTTDADQQWSTLQTRTGQLLGTLPYMSPEQISGRGGTDPRSDIYSLGVMLYELLAGRLPLDLEGRSLTEVARVLSAVDPLPLGRVRRDYRGDLETICSKALSKEREYRYGTAAEFGEDLQRFLDHEPIAARPQTTLYQLKKFIRRNKLLVSGVAGTLAALVGGIIVAVVLLFRAERSEAAARRGNYAARITAAQANMAGDPISASQQLRDAPEELRGWEFDWLRGQLDPVEVSFVPPRGLPCDVTIRPDGTLLCLAREGEALILYDVLRGAEIAEYRVPLRYQDAFLSRDGMRVGAERIDENIPTRSEHLRILDAASGRVLEDHEDPFSPAAFAEIVDPHASQFYAAQPYAQIFALVFSPDRRRLLEATQWNHSVQLREPESKAVLATLAGHQAPIRSAAFTRDSARVVTSCPGDSTVRVWDVATGSLQRTILVEHPGRVTVSDDGSRIAVLSEGQVKLLATTDAASRVIPIDDYVYAVAVDADLGFVVAGTHHRTVKMFDLWSGREIDSWNGGSTSLGIDPASRRLIIADGVLDQRDFVDLTRLTREQGDPSLVAPGMRNGENCTSPDGTLQARIDGDGIAISPTGDAAVERQRLAVPPDCGVLSALAISSDNQRLAAGFDDGSIAVFDLATGGRLATLRRHAGKVFTLVFLPDGTRLVSGGNDRTVRLWDTDSFDQVAVLRGHTDYVRSIAVSDDGTCIATGSGDRTLRIWDRLPRRQRVALRSRAATLWNEHRRRVLGWLQEVRDPVAVADRIARERSLDHRERAVLQRHLADLLAFRETPAADPRTRREAYLALIAAASATWQDDAALAWEYLDRAPADLRGPEWQWLRDIEELRPFQSCDRHGTTADCVAYRHDGTPLHAFVQGDRLQIVDVATQATVRELEYGGGIAAPSLSADGTRVLAWGLEAGKPRHLLEWDLASGDLATEVRDCPDAGGSIVWGPFRRVVWPQQAGGVANAARSVTVFDLDTETAVLHKPQQSGSLFLLPDGERLRIGNALLDLVTGQQAPRGFAPGTVWSSDGELAGFRQDSNGFGLRDGGTLQPLPGFQGKAGNGRALAFSPDSKWFAATLAPAERIAVWNVASRQRRLTVAGTAIAFAPDGSEIVVTSKHGAKVYSLRGPTPAEVRAAVETAKIEMHEVIEPQFAELDVDAVTDRITNDAELDATQRRAALEIVFDRRLRALLERLAE